MQIGTYLLDLRFTEYQSKIVIYIFNLIVVLTVLIF